MAELGDKIMVCIHCMTYNHEKYLADALEGFVMQKTDFPFVAVVIDDFSTDGTADVLREYEARYPDIIKAVYLQENYYSQRKSKRPFLDPWDNNAKYIALCEGDDYWIDPYKLQKQVQFLEYHYEYIMTCHKIAFNYDGQICPKEYDINFNSEGYYEFSNIENIKKWYSETASILYRRKDMPKIEPSKYKYYRDVHTQYHLLSNSKGIILDFQGSVYRKHNNGVYSSLSEIQQLYIANKIYTELVNNNPNDIELRHFWHEFIDYTFEQIRNYYFAGQANYTLNKILFQNIQDIQSSSQNMGYIKYLQKVLKSYFLGVKHRHFYG